MDSLKASTELPITFRVPDGNNVGVVLHQPIYSPSLHIGVILVVRDHCADCAF